MAKSIKLSNDYYWDIGSLRYNNSTSMKAKLDATDTAVTNAQNTATSALNKANDNGSKMLYITATGSANSGVYFKFSNGWMLTLQRYQVQVNTWGTWGNGLYAGECVSMKNFPATFKEIPYVSVTMETNSINGWLATRSEKKSQTTVDSPACYQVVRGTGASSGATFIIDVIAFGKY